MTTKVSIFRRWTGPIPIGRDGKPIPTNLWPRRRKHVWVVRWFAPDAEGKLRRPSKTFPTREEAEKFQAEKASAFANVPGTRKVAREMTLQQFISELLELRLGPRGQRLKVTTVVLYRHALEALAGVVGQDRPVRDIGPRDAARFLSRMHEQNRNRATLNKFKRTLAAAFNVAISPMGLIRENPFKGIKADRVSDSPIRCLSSEEFAALMDVCETLWWRAWLAVCYTAGLRYSEAAHLLWADVNFARETVRVTRKTDGPDTIAWTPKDYETREVPIPGETTALLAELHATASESHAYVFLPADRFRLIKDAQRQGLWREEQAVLNNFQRSFRRLILRAAEAAPTLKDAEDKPTISMHDLRRSAITNWSRRANIQTVMRMAGHSNIETTRRYYAATTDDQIALVREASAAAVSGRQKDRGK